MTNYAAENKAVVAQDRNGRSTYNCKKRSSGENFEEMEKFNCMDDYRNFHK
jgi:hypothetical protein